MQWRAPGMAQSGPAVEFCSLQQRWSDKWRVCSTDDTIFSTLFLARLIPLNPQYQKKEANNAETDKCKFGGTHGAQLNRTRLPH